jgi:hypothetical protein
MADIKQAALWMREGKMVARKFKAVEGFGRPDVIFADENGIIRARCYGLPDSGIYATIDALLAEDWYISREITNG